MYSGMQVQPTKETFGSKNWFQKNATCLARSTTFLSHSQGQTLDSLLGFTVDSTVAKPESIPLLVVQITCHLTTELIVFTPLGKMRD